MVVQPFISAMVFAGVLAIATWPLFERLRHSLGGNPTLAATVMLLAILVLVGMHFRSACYPLRQPISSRRSPTSRRGG